MTRPQWRDAAKEKFWRRMVRRWRQSGLTVRAFCEQYELSEPSFYGWRRVLAQRDRQTTQATAGSSARPAAKAKRSAVEAVPDAVLPAFVQVEVTAERSGPGDSATAVDGIEVVVRGRVVRLRRGFAAARDAPRLASRPLATAPA
jgi:transposase-like protein